MTSTLHTYTIQSSNICICYLLVRDVIEITSVDAYKNKKTEEK